MTVPKVIVFANSKGGVGKSTLVRSLAAHWMNMGMKPLIIDADPQASVFTSHDENGLMAKIPVLAEPEVTVGELIEENLGKYHPIIVDTGGFSNQTNVMALLNCDMVVIPLRTSKDDVRGAKETLSLVNELNETAERENNPILAKLLLTNTQKNTVISRHVRKELEDIGLPLFDAEMPLRVAYPETALAGIAPPLTEPDGAAARDIYRIAIEISKSAK